MSNILQHTTKKSIYNESCLMMQNFNQAFKVLKLSHRLQIMNHCMNMYIIYDSTTLINTLHKTVKLSEQVYCTYFLILLNKQILNSLQCEIKQFFKVVFVIFVHVLLKKTFESIKHGLSSIALSVKHEHLKYRIVCYIC